ncbi:MAG: HD-GYP domain-containing protein [Gammaproteobacteria bacterium]|nr:MAG: HD-GYP domain-containing protein [Gammaproteobacteria bacterium]
MIKRIPIDALKVGMYVSDLNSDWIPHNNLKKSGYIRREEVIEKIRTLGIRELYIDTSRGLDTQDGLTRREVDDLNTLMLEEAGELAPIMKPVIGLDEEMRVAEKLHQEALGLVDNVMKDVKVGKAVDVSAFEELADGMVDSIFRNHNALSCLGRIREKDAYLMEHSVNLGVLMSVFGKSIQLPRDVLQQAAVGALLHDIGKTLIPDEVLHKPGKLTDKEFAVMKKHAEFSRQLLEKSEGITPLTVKVAAEHHERMDGTGYPQGLKGEQISAYGRMAAIVDVYDAITADRCYHKGMPPTEAIKKLLEWSGHHLDRGLVHHFIRCIGIYPVGSLVLLESGRLGVVIEANEADQRLPVVRVMYHTRFRSYIKQERLDLAHPKCQDRIVKAVDPDDYRIRVRDFL